MAAGTSKPRLVIDRVLCISDIERALRLLQTPGRRKNKALKQIFRLLREAAEQRLSIQFTWVPAHSGLQGNEMAHDLPHWSTILGRIPIDRKIHTPRTLEARPATSRVETSPASVPTCSTTSAATRQSVTRKPHKEAIQQIEIEQRRHYLPNFAQVTARLTVTFTKFDKRTMSSASVTNKKQ